MGLNTSKLFTLPKSTCKLLSKNINHKVGLLGELTSSLIHPTQMKI